MPVNRSEQIGIAADRFFCSKKKKTKKKKTHRSLKNTSGLPSTSRSFASSSLPVLSALMSSKVISSGLYSSRQAMVALLFVVFGEGKEEREDDRG